MAPAIKRLPWLSITGWPDHSIIFFSGFSLGFSCFWKSKIFSPAKLKEERTPKPPAIIIWSEVIAKNGSEIHVTDGAIIATGDVYVKEGAVFDIYNDEEYLDPVDPITALALVAQGNIKIYSNIIKIIFFAKTNYYISLQEIFL